MSSLASHGRHLFSQATGHADENEAAADDDDDFDLAFSDSDDDSSSGEQKTSGGGGGAMSFGCVEEAVSETESQAVKPFIGAIFPPDNHQPSHGHNEAPNATLQLEYVFGYCKNTRDAIFSLGNNQVFWPSASVGILYNQNQAGSASAQSHLIGHRDEITAAAQSSSNPQFIATGSSQLTRKHEYPTAIVWDTRNNAQINSYQSVHLKRQVDALAFDDSGQYLFAAGAGDKHNIVCYNVRDGSETSYVSSGSSRVLAMEYDSSTRSLVVGGVKSLQFISFGNGTFGTPQRVSADTFVSIKSSGGTTYCGSARGKIITYKRGAQSGSVNGHKGGVYSIAVQGRNVATGGKNGTVTVWKDESHGLSKLRTFNLALPGAAKGIAFNGPDVVVGSKNGRVVQLNTSTGEETLLGSGHCDGETWGLAMHPFDMQCVTTGDDNMIRCWDLVSMTCTKSKKLSNVKIKIGNQNKSTRVKSRSSQRRGKRGGAATTGSFGPSNCSRAVDYDPFGEHIAVGMNDGSFMVLDEATLSKVAHKRGRGRSQWVQDLKFSPLDQVLAVSTHDNFVDLWSYNDANKYTRMAVLEGHRSFITHLDWSADGQFLQTNCGSYELLFWDTKNIDSKTKKCKRVGRASSLADTDWQSINCVINWGCTGIWYSPEGYMLNACDRSHDRGLLAVGEDSSLIKLYKWPCVGTFVKSGRDPKLGGADANTSIGHGSHVSNVRFSFDDSKLVSVGGGDNATMVWRVVQ